MLRSSPAKADVAASARGLVRRAFRDHWRPSTAATVILTPPLSRWRRTLRALPPPSFRSSRATPLISRRIMVEETGALADPLQGARLTLYGVVAPTTDEGVRRRFLARHGEASLYADFPDFAFWRLAVEGAHYIGGFGRIFDLGPSDLLCRFEAPRPSLRASLALSST